MHITDYLKRNAVKFPDKLAIVFDRESLTWAQLWHKVDTAASLLSTQISSTEPQVVGLLIPNSIQYVVSYLAIAQAGHMALPIDVIFKELEISAIIAQVGPVLTITDNVGFARLPKTAKTLLYDELASAKNKKYAPIRLPADEQVACLLFTSGTTGKPKISPNTHANIIWNIEVCTKVWDWNTHDVQLVNLRLSHWHGLVMGLCGCLYHASTMYLQENFEAQATAEALASGRITMFTHTAYAYIGLAHLKKDYDFSKVRIFISGAAPLPPKIWQEFSKKFGHEIVETYGSTETGRIAGNRLNDRAAGSPGFMFPGVKHKTGGKGELWVKSAGLFPGYWHNPAATDKNLDKDGYWRTGDIAEISNGRLVLKGRTVERIRRLGYTISPRDVEWAMHQLSPIKEIYVMGLPQPGMLDDRLVYFVVGSVSEFQINEYCRKNLPSVWRPDTIVIVDKLPRTRSGKPQMAALKKMVTQDI